jgi:hypothetical protein
MTRFYSKYWINVWKVPLVHILMGSTKTAQQIAVILLTSRLTTNSSILKQLKIFFLPENYTLGSILTHIIIPCATKSSKSCTLKDFRLTNNNSVASVRKRTIPSERPPLVSEVSVNFLRIQGATWSAWRIPTAVFSAFLTGAATIASK